MPEKMTLGQMQVLLHQREMTAFCRQRKVTEILCDLRLIRHLVHDVRRLVGPHIPHEKIKELESLANRFETGWNRLQRLALCIDADVESYERLDPHYVPSPGNANAQLRQAILIEERIRQQFEEEEEAELAAG